MGIFSKKKSILDSILKQPAHTEHSHSVKSSQREEKVHVPIKVMGDKSPVSIAIDQNILGFEASHPTAEAFELIPNLIPKKISVFSSEGFDSNFTTESKKHLNVTYLQEFPKTFPLKPEQYFNLITFSKLASLHDLHKALATMTTEEWSRHVDAHHNEFADWIKDAFHNPELAIKANNCMNPTDLRTLLDAFV